MYDVRRALNDIASQLRACRARDGLTLAQLATRCGVAASTIHKIECQQMVPTVSVLLKIARGLGRRPEELVRDCWSTDSNPSQARAGSNERESGEAAHPFDREIGVWRFDFERGERLETLQLEPGQRAILLVERGEGEFASHSRRVRLGAGQCVEAEGEPFTFSSERTAPAATLLIVSPAGRLAVVLGTPSASGTGSLPIG